MKEKGKALFHTCGEKGLYEILTMLFSHRRQVMTMTTIITRRIYVGEENIV
jgi:hypothetical protein